MNTHEAHYYLEELQRMMTQHRGIFSEEFVRANGMAILALEQKTGKWLAGDKMEGYPRIPYKSWKTYCSCCGEEAYNGDTLFDYCPNCGARMEE